MADPQTDSVKKSWAQRLKQFVVPAATLLMAAGILFLIAGNWNTWASERVAQTTDDAYVRADLTPLSTKVAGLVASVGVSDYQPVKAGDLLVQLRDDDFRAQLQQASAAVTGGEDALVNNQRQKELQDARIVQAEEGIRAAEADIAAAEAGIEAAKSGIANAAQRNHGEPRRTWSVHIGAAPAGSVDCGRVGHAAEAGAGGRGGRALSCAAVEPGGRSQYGSGTISESAGGSGPSTRPARRHQG